MSDDWRIRNLIEDGRNLLGRLRGQARRISKCPVVSRVINAEPEFQRACDTIAELGVLLEAVEVELDLRNAPAKFCVK